MTGLNWNDPAGPMVQPERDDWEIGRRVRARVAAMTDNGRDHESAQVLAASGRRASDRLAREAQQAVDWSDLEPAARDAYAARGAFPAVDSPSATERRRQERWAASRPCPNDFLGTGRDRDDAEYEQWRHHFWRHCGIDPDDLEQDAWLDSGYGIDADDMHHRSPDLDDLIPEQRDDHVQEQTR